MWTKVEDVLWEPGSVDRMLAWGNPTPLADPDTRYVVRAMSRLPTADDRAFVKAVVKAVVETVVTELVQRPISDARAPGPPPRSPRRRSPGRGGRTGRT